MGQLNQKTAIVTGSTSGIGRGIAECFAREGATLVINGRNCERGNQTVENIKQSGGQAIFVQSDISTVEGAKHLIDQTISHYGKIDILVPNAGGLGNGKITDLPIEMWTQTIDTNLNSLFYLMKFALPHMQKQTGSSVLVIGSIAAWKQFPSHPAYCASKAAAVALVKQSALDYGPEVRINILCPGQVDTPLLRNSAAAFPDPDQIIQDNIDKLIVMKRLGTPQDIADAALFLISDRASWITGTAMVVDGGRLLSN